MMQGLKSFYKKHQKPIVISVQLILLGIIFWFLTDRITGGLVQATEVVKQLHWQLFVATGLFAGAVIVSGTLWGRMINTLGSHKPIAISESIRVHSLAWLFKYFPGQGGGVLSKIIWGQRHGIERKAVLTSVLYENIFLASSSVLLSFPFLGVTVLAEISGEGSLLVPFVLTLSVFPFLIPKFFTQVITIGLKIIGRKPPTKNLALSGSEVIDNQLLFLLPRLINGIGFVLIASIFIEIGIASMMQLGGAYILGGIIGILAFFVPSGIGVREAVIVIGTGSVLGADTAIAAAILARVCATIGDVIIALVYVLLQGIYGKKQAAHSN